MTLIIETGTGVRGANTYIPVAFVTQYLTDRNRVTENSWSTITTDQQEAALIAATAYLEKKYSQKFIGSPEVAFTETFAKTTITFTGLPVADETFKLGDETYKFVSSLSGESFEILIGGDADTTATNTKDAISATSLLEEVTYGKDTEANRHATAEASGSVITLTAVSPGDSGEYTELSGTVSNVTLGSFSGARQGGSQTLSWPRQYAYDILGNLITGIPLAIKEAVSEYAVRAVSSSLQSDPTTDSYGGEITRRYEKVGPIEEEVVYSGGTLYKFTFPPYPAADSLLKSLIRGSGGSVIRG